MDDRDHNRDQSAQLQRVIGQLNRGDASVRGELLNLAEQQLKRLTGEIQRELDCRDGAGAWDRAGTLDRTGTLDRAWEELFEGAAARLYEALHEAVIKDARHFYQVASLQIRRELIELCRQGGQSTNRDMAEMAQLHDCVDALSSDAKEVFELIWYHEMTLQEAADLLGRPVSSIRRLWRSARLELHGRFDDRASGDSKIKFAGD